ncbi:MAG: cell surface protein, partial [Pirellulaceae bacterium]|nr:cell surface protein [Pirellulaceae bacterium]
LSLFAASAVTVIGDIPVGQSNPVQIEVVERPFQFIPPSTFIPATPPATQLLVPSGAELTAGEQITVVGPTSNVTLTYVNILTGAPNEILFSSTDSQDDVARSVLAALPVDTAAVYEGNGFITFLNTTNVTLTASASQIAIDNGFSVSENRFFITVANGDNLVDGETLTFTTTSGTSVVTFVDTANPVGPGQVAFQAGDTVATIATRLQAVLGDDLQAIRQGNDILVIASSVTTDVAGTNIAFGQVASQLIDVPSGANLIDGEILRVNTAAGVTDITFIDSANAGPAGTVNFQAGDSAAVIRGRLATALGGVTFSTAGGLKVYGATNATALNNTSQINTSFVNGQQVTMPDAAQMVSGESINIDVGGTITTITFVDTATGAANEVVYGPTDTGGQIAANLLGVLDPSLDAAIAGATVFFTADSVAHNLGASAITVTAGTYNDTLVNLNIPDALDLRNGEQINVFGNSFETITFILRGSTVPDTGSIQVYYDPTDLAADLYQQIIDGLQANYQVYVDPNGDGINIVDPGTVAFNGVDPIATEIRSRDVSEIAIPITIPNGAEITSGETLVITQKDDVAGTNATTFTLIDQNFATGAINELTYDPNDTADQVTLDLLRQLPRSLQAFLVNTREIYLLNASSVTTQTGSLIVSFESIPTATPILVDSTMTTQQVTERLQFSFAEGFGRVAALDGVSTATPDNFKVYGTDRIRLFNATPVDAGAFGTSSVSIISGGAITTTPVPGDEFGEDQPGAIATSQIRTAGAQNNEVEGVYIDDIIIGFAERGEMVINAPFNNTDFVFNPETLPDTHPLAIQPERQNETLLGGYSLEIRTADDYGVEEDYDPINLVLSEQLSSGRSFDTNDRLVDGAVTLIVPSPNDLLDGDIFTLDDGDRMLTFEFDNILDGNITIGNVRIPFNTANSDPAFLSKSVRDAINSPQVQGVLDITAATSDSFEIATPSGNRVELFGDAITVNHSGGRFLKVDLVAEETFQGRETSKQIPQVDHTTETTFDTSFGDELARSAVTQFFDGSVDTLVAVGKIGDAVNTGADLQDGAIILPSLPEEDFDSVRIYLEMGQTVDIDVDTVGFSKATEKLELPVITVFEQNRFGAYTPPNILGQSSLFAPQLAPGEVIPGAFLQFTAPTDGYYDVMVSSDALFGGIGDIGEYQLTIRPNAAASAAVPDRDVLMVDYQFGQSDANRVSPQGQIIISSNFISDSAQFGIAATNAPRGATVVNPAGAPDSLPRPGTPALLRNQNSDGIIPGVVISNNVVVASGSAAILFSGDTSADGEVLAPTLFGRIVNNTVVGQGVADGIRISGSASPTILNNIVAFFDQGITTTSDQVGEVIVGRNAYQNNNTDSTLGLSTSSVVIPQEVDLFEDPARRVYIPAAGSDVIDSSFASLPDRDEFFETVKEPVGISRSPIIAPKFDAYGQARVDDPNVATPGGVGVNVFIDRGAIDRADDERPVAVLTGPQDAIGLTVDGGDQDVDQSFVRLSEGIVEFFDVQLIDTAGTGLDPLTITSRNVILTENGRQLIPGVDYIFGYSTNSRTIRLTPLTGLWRSDSVYEITLNNRPRVEVTLPTGDKISDGDQVIVIEGDGTQTAFEFDSGFSLVVPQTTTLNFSGTNANVQDEQTLVIDAPNGESRTLEIDNDNFISVGNTNIIVDVNNAGTVLAVRDAFLAALNSVDPVLGPLTVAEALGLQPAAVGASQLQLGSIAGHVVTSNVTSVAVSGIDSGVQDGDTFTYTTATDTVTFELTTDALVGDPSFIPVMISRTDTPDQIAQAIATEVANANLGLGTAQAIGNGTVLVGGVVGDTLTLGQANLQLLGSPGVTAGAFIVPFLPTPQFTSALSATALQAAIRNSTAGVEVFSPGAGTLLISGAQLVQGTFNGSVPSSIGVLLPAVADLAGNPVRETRITEETRFTIIMPDVVFDYSDAPASYGTLDADNGARHTVADARLPRLGTYLDTETDGRPFPGSDDAPLSLTATETGVVFTTLFPGSDIVSIVVNANTPSGGETVTLTVDGVITRFELVLSTSNPGAGNVPVTFVPGDTPGDIATKLSQAIRGRIEQIDESVIMTLDATNGVVTLEAIDDEDGIAIGTFVSSGISYQVFTVPGTPSVNVMGSDVLGFLNPLDPAGSAMAVTVAGSGLLDA